MESRLRQAGIKPIVEIVPRVGLKPTMELNAPGTRPEPFGKMSQLEKNCRRDGEMLTAVSVPREKET